MSRGGLTKEGGVWWDGDEWGVVGLGGRVWVGIRGGDGGVREAAAHCL